MSALECLVTSKPRRRLVTLIWRDDKRGTASALADAAAVSFASAYRELRRLYRAGLLVSEQVDGVEIYRANPAHPETAALRVLATKTTALPQHERDRSLRAQLAREGAPLLVEDTTKPSHLSLVHAVAKGARMARRDPSVARALPVLLYLQRERLFERAEELADVARVEGTRHVLGFLLAVAAKHGGDPRLAELALSLRDHRVRSQDFFDQHERGRPTAMRNALAAEWGLRMRMTDEDFATTFRKALPTE